MSEAIHHECGIALVRLLKPLEYYLANYGTAFYGLNKLHLLMQKQHNRGQDGAGIAVIKYDMEPGNKYINRIRSNSAMPLQEIFETAIAPLKALEERYPQRLKDIPYLKSSIEMAGELYLGHLRYGTYGKNNILNIHPFVRENNWMTKNLVLAGNFNMTNVDELFEKLIDLGQYPIETSDTITILEKIGHFLDKENEELYQRFKQQGLPKRAISAQIARSLDLQKILSKAAKTWDGGYVIAGLLGHGDAFVMRDPNGIRPAFYYHNDEIAIVTSERPVIQTAMDLSVDQIKELTPGHALIIRKDGTIHESEIIKNGPVTQCSFERIYFSRGTDQDIYLERKQLGKCLSPSILAAIDYDIENTVFSYIPNTAIDAYYGLIEEIDLFCDQIKADRIVQAGQNTSREQLLSILSLKPRVEKIAVKDMKLRTFITKDSQRNDLVTHIYDITYGSIRKGKDNLVVLDDSIVRGTTLRQSILRILDRLGPRKIIVASSAPQIRYPDCYGIDMAKITDFVAFKAAIALLKENHMEGIIHDVYLKSKAQEKMPKEEIKNYVREIYKPFSPEAISQKISSILTPPDCKATVQIIFQSIEDLHASIPGHKGDWYFTGDYPTPGGNKVVNKAFINYIEGRNIRAY
jgi:amidophosphoribosyltransferase